MRRQQLSHSWPGFDLSSVILLQQHASSKSSPAHGAAKLVSCQRRGEAAASLCPVRRLAADLNRHETGATVSLSPACLNPHPPPLLLVNQKLALSRASASRGRGPGCLTIWREPVPARLPSWHEHCNDILNPFLTAGQSTWLPACLARAATTPPDLSHTWTLEMCCAFHMGLRKRLEKRMVIMFCIISLPR